MKIKVECPAKINLSLKVFKKDEITGFHPIESIMQSVNLFDYLTVETTNTGKINLSGSSNEILYDENNLVYRACEKFFEVSKIKNEGLNIYIEKNIPIAAGLAGGSTDAAGMILALNYIYNNILNSEDIYYINSTLGSDINFCYQGGLALCKGKGDNIERLPFVEFDLSVIKPKGLKIPTKDAYSAFDNLEQESNLPNDLEFAMLPFYEELQKLHALNFQMSGSGPSFFIKKSHVDIDLNKEKYEIFENLKSINTGVKLIQIDSQN